MDPITFLAHLRLSDAITRLPQAIQEAIETALETELNLSEAADRLGLPYATFYGRFARGLQLLRNDLRHDPHIEAYFEAYFNEG